MYMYVYGFVQAHIELQETLAASQKKTLGGLQESTTKMMTQQAEAAQYTADAARHIKEVSNQFPPPCLEKACALIVQQKLIDCWRREKA